MKKNILIFFFFAGLVFSQNGLVRYDHKVYSFLERMDALNIIQNYDEFEIPKSIFDIKIFLKKIDEEKGKLNEVDRKILNDFQIEFEYFLKVTTHHYSSLLNGDSLFSNDEKYLYFYKGIDGAFFVNGEVENQNLFINVPSYGNSRNVSLIKFGGSIEGIFKNKFGFFIRGTNGTFFGSKSLARAKTNLRYNYKFNREDRENSGNDYFDETEGYLFADFDFIKLKIGRDRRVIGYGINKSILSGNPPPMDYLSLELKYKKFGFSFFHGKLLGSLSVEENELSGSYNRVADKYLSYHRFYFNLNRHLNFGIGETVIYSNRSIDLSYLNPFNFYKSAEHLNQDRDNTMLFLDAVNNSIDGLKFYGTLLIDDLDFGKVGTGWYGNKLLWQFGFYSAQLYNLIPLQIRGEYLRVEPYVFSHRINENNFTHLGFNLAGPLQPNSQVFSLAFYYQPHYRFDLDFVFRYTEHGSNYIDTQPPVSIVNVGGDINLGHRKSDSEEIDFLDGFPEYFRTYSFSAKYEPINNYFVFANVEYINEDTYPDIFNVDDESLFINFGLMVRL